MATHHYHHPTTKPPLMALKTHEERALYEAAACTAARVTKRARVLHPKSLPGGLHYASGGLDTGGLSYFGRYV